MKHYRHPGLDPGSPSFGDDKGIAGQARNDGDFIQRRQTMTVENIPIWPEATEAYMTTYRMERSPFHKDRLFPAILIAPGGAYLGTSDREAEQVALAYVAKGYMAFVLRYSCGEKARFPRPIIEGFKAIGMIRANAKDWHIDPTKIAICGFSAGGHLCGSLSNLWHRQDLAKQAGYKPDEIRPNAAILCYPATALPIVTGGRPTDVPENMLQAYIEKMNIPPEIQKAIFIKDGMVHYDLGKAMMDSILGENWTPEDAKAWSCEQLIGDHTPPSFVWTTADDATVPAEDIINYVLALRKAGHMAEFHMFAHGVHGLSLATDITADNPTHVNPEVEPWLDLSVAWLTQAFSQGSAEEGPA